MTIKEIEDRSGMTRANIRFYESEGLLHPGRRENGYRDYSSSDLEALHPSYARAGRAAGGHPRHAGRRRGAF